MQTINGKAYCEYEVKRSRFIGSVCGVKNKQAALDFIRQVKAKSSSATRNVYAYIISEEKIQKSTDDGEPKGTAGLPILGVLSSMHLTNVVIVVTRYFGGIMLGAGGLARAYSTTAKLTIEKAELVMVKKYLNIKLEVKYNFYSIITMLLDKFKTSILKIEFFDKIYIELEIVDTLFEQFKLELINICHGDVTIIKRDDKFDF